jgi:hypothetical protein
MNTTTQIIKIACKQLTKANEFISKVDGKTDSAAKKWLKARTGDIGVHANEMRQLRGEVIGEINMIAHQNTANIVQQGNVDLHNIAQKGKEMIMEVLAEVGSPKYSKSPKQAEVGGPMCIDHFKLLLEGKTIALRGDQMQEIRKWQNGVHFDRKWLKIGTDANGTPIPVAFVNAKNAEMQLQYVPTVAPPVTAVPPGEWFYLSDQWMPYASHDSDQLEAWYQSGPSRGQRVLTVNAAVKLAIDFEGMMQTNVANSCKRAIRRVLASAEQANSNPQNLFQVNSPGGSNGHGTFGQGAGLGRVEWDYMSHDQQFRPYDAASSAVLSLAAEHGWERTTLYVSGPSLMAANNKPWNCGGCSFFNMTATHTACSMCQTPKPVHLRHDVQQYDVDLTGMKQTNANTHVSRDIRRRGSTGAVAPHAAGMGAGNHYNQQNSVPKGPNASPMGGFGHGFIPPSAPPWPPQPSAPPCPPGQNLAHMAKQMSLDDSESDGV